MLHDYLHCLVFKEQSVLSLSALASSDSFILSPSDQLVNNFFEVFSKLFGCSQWPAIQGLLSCFVAVSVSDLYYITRVGEICQHLFLQKHTKSYLVLQTGTCFVDFAECLAGLESTSLLHAPVTTAH